MAEAEYFEKTPKKAGRWFRAFIVLSLLYGITYSLYSIFNWILFFSAAYSLFMSYFLLPVQPKIFQAKPKFNSGGKGNTFQGQRAAANPVAQRTKAIIIGVAAFIFILMMIPFIQGMIGGTGETSEQQPLEVQDTSITEPAQDFLAKGNDFFNQQQYDSALKYYEAALEADPSETEAIYGKGIVAYNQGNVEMANRYFVEAYDAGFRFYWLSWALADMYDKQGQTSRAIELYKESVNLDSTTIDSYKRLAELEPANSGEWLRLAEKFKQD